MISWLETAPSKNPLKKQVGPSLDNVYLVINPFLLICPVVQKLSSLCQEPRDKGQVLENRRAPAESAQYAAIVPRTQ